MKISTKILSRVMIVVSVFSLSGCFENEIKVNGSLAASSLGISSNILLQNATLIDVKELDTANVVEAVSELTLDLNADCSATEEIGFSPAVGEVNLDGRVLTALNSLCVEASYAQILKEQYSQALESQSMTYDDVFKSCTDTETCENLRVAIFILTDGNETYGLQLEMLSETAGSDPYLTLLTIVGDGKLEYYGEVIPKVAGARSQISSVIDRLLALDIDGVNTSNSNKKNLKKSLQEKAVYKELDVAVEQQYWSSDNTLTEAGGDKVFTKVANAVKEILKAKARIDRESNDASVSALLNTLDELETILIQSMRSLAVDRIAVAKAANGREDRIDDAIEHIEDGDKLISGKNAYKGIKLYRSSWNGLTGAY